MVLMLLLCWRCRLVLVIRTAIVPRNVTIQFVKLELIDQLTSTPSFGAYYCSSVFSDVVAVAAALNVASMRSYF